MNPIMNMLGSMMGGVNSGNPMMKMMQGMMGGGQGSGNPIQMISQLMSGKGTPQQLIDMAVKQNPQLQTVIQAFQSGNTQQGFQELSKINPQFAQSVQGKTPEQLQQMVGQAMQQMGVNSSNDGMK